LLHRVGCVGHIVHFSASGALNIDALFFILWWARCRFHKNRVRTHDAKLVFLHLVVSAGNEVYSGASRDKMSMHYFSCSGGPGAVSIKAHRDTLR
jgi:hypothetical protein